MAVPYRPLYTPQYPPKPVVPAAPAARPSGIIGPTYPLAPGSYLPATSPAASGPQPPSANDGGGQTWPSPHPPNAAYVSDDGLVSYDSSGRRLDAFGNVAYGGGGGGGGGGGTSTGFGSIPDPYKLAFASVFGPIEAYYTPQRGGEAQAASDYKSLGYLWENNAGTPLMPEMYPSVFGAYGSTVKNTGAAPTMSGLMGFAQSSLLTRPPTPPMTSFLKVGEI